MKIMKKWQKIIDELDFAYQPIISFDTGKVIGFESLLRNTEKTEFKTIDGFFDKAYEENILYEVELELRKNTIKKFLKYKNPNKFKLFLNIDNRIINTKKFETGKTKEFLKSLNVEDSFITFEISEKHQINSLKDLKKLFRHYEKQDFQIAIDDYGSGFSSMELLYHSDPEYIKIDMFFIQGIDKNLKKQIFLKKIVEISHLLGYLVIAEGVETKEEFLYCKDLGIDMLQGYFLEKPNIKLKSLPDHYELVPISNRTKKENSDITDNIEIYPSIHYKSLFSEVFTILKENNFVVVVDDDNVPLGVLEDRKLKEYIYSPYGNELLSKKIIFDKMDKFITKSYVADINEPIEKLIQIFSHNNGNNFSSIIIKKTGKYKGILSAQKLLEIIHKKQLFDTKDQNPLTKLGGNSTINKYIQKCMNKDENYLHIYFDLDNFKPYNDTYGFRNGDRIILLFADILRNFANNNKNIMIGHIGGDDFFLSISLKNRDIEETLKFIRKIIEKFSKDVISFYNKDDIKKGHIESKDREGNIKKFNFLTVSAAILEVNGTKSKFKNKYGDVLAKLKKAAKHSPEHYSIATLL
jgi:diguanylate cyclase (GGDEF)-like protein